MSIVLRRSREFHPRTDRQVKRALRAVTSKTFAGFLFKPTRFRVRILDEADRTIACCEQQWAKEQARVWAAEQCRELRQNGLQVSFELEQTA